MTQEAGRPELVHIVLPFRGYEILSPHPVHCVTVGSKTKSVTVLGHVGKMTGRPLLCPRQSALNRMDSCRLEQD
jgi:hypothetical protein